MSTPAHTPYDGSSKPFAIGLKPLDPARLIETHGDLAALLEEKARLDRLDRAAVFAAEPDTEAAQQEALDLLADHLLTHHGGSYRRSGDSIDVLPAKRRVALDGNAPPLLTAGRLVADDLVLMRRGGDGWRLAAASLSFPSSWRLREKFGQPIHEIHRPVPGFGPNTRAAELIARVFDRLAPGRPVERFNWSLQGDGTLHLPFGDGERNERARAGASRFGDDPVGGAWIRVERQTLAKLPRSGDLLFTIRIHLDPLRWLRERPDRAALAGSLAADLRGLGEDQLRYKGLHADCDRLAAGLERLAGSGRPAMSSREGRTVV